MTDATQTAEFVELFTRHARQLYAYILTLMGHDPAVDDVFQDTSRLLWEKFDQFQPGTNFVAWGCRIAYFRVLKHRENSRKESRMFSDSLYEAIENDLVAMSDDLDGELRALADCYGKLSSQDRDLIDLRYAPESNMKEVARKLGRPLSSVYRMLDRVHESLLRCVERTTQSFRHPR